MVRHLIPAFISRVMRGTIVLHLYVCVTELLCVCSVLYLQVAFCLMIYWFIYLFILKSSSCLH